MIHHIVFNALHQFEQLQFICSVIGLPETHIFPGKSRLFPNTHLLLLLLGSLLLLLLSLRTVHWRYFGSIVDLGLSVKLFDIIYVSRWTALRPILGNISILGVSIFPLSSFLYIIMPANNHDLSTATTNSNN